MQRRNLVLVFVAVTAMIAVAALSDRKNSRLLLLEWANRGRADKPPAAVLIELGARDTEPTKWSNRATVQGARVVHREGYRFRRDDKLVEPNGWQVSSHRGLHVPPRNPAASRMEGLATVGVVLHLADVSDDATLTLTPREPGGENAVVRLRDVLAGRRQPIWNGTAVVPLLTTATPLTSGPTEDDFPAAAYGPDGTLWVAYVSYRLRDESRRIEQPDYKEQPPNFDALYKPEFADQLFVRYHRGGRWSEPVAVTGPNEDLVRCAVAVEGDGTAWVAYSANRQGRYDVYARPVSPRFSKEAVRNAAPLRPGPETRLSEGPGPNLTPVMCTARPDQLLVAFQSAKEGRLGLQLVSFRQGQFQGGLEIAPGAGNQWYAALAAGPGGDYVLAYDEYRHGDYDVALRRPAENAFPETRVASSARFEARPSACYDDRGRLWVAYEEGPEQWGKDFGSLVPDAGEPLFSSRSVRVVCLDRGQLFRPVAELPTSTVKAPTAGNPQNTQQYEKATRYAYPRLGLDGKGRLWLTYRVTFGTRYSSHPGSYGLTYARRLDGDRWTDPVEVHHSDGLLDHRPVLLPHAGGGLVIVHNTDGRYTTPDHIQNRVYTSYLDLPGDVVEPKLVPHEAGTKDVGPDEEVRAAVRRIRDYRIEAGGKTYRPLRGEFHRHTETSWDGGGDGSLEDMFRYALDAAAMDWVGNGDHDNGAGREYPWWLTQKLTDAYTVKDRFTPTFCYERSVSYPMGHRNCMFARRGVLTLPRLVASDPEKRVGGVHPDDTKMLYRYLKQLDGICAVHTSATGMGTDWRDNDPVIEPVVEVYQGDRNSYEMKDTPRAGHDPRSGKKPVNIAGWYPKGFINNALEKGYKLGFQSSSDHWSTHISYCIALAERHDRKGVVAAFQKRHVYAATDNIILDVRSGDHIMGDAFRTGQAPALQIRVVGTGPLDQVDVLRDSTVVERLKPDGREYRGTWTDPKPEAGTHYYYVRVQQKDGQLAWGSPMWVEYAK